MTKFLAFSPGTGGGGGRKMSQTSIKVFFERKLKEVNGVEVGVGGGIPLTPPASATATPGVKKGAAAADKENEDDGVIVITSDNDDGGEIDLAKKSSGGGGGGGGRSSSASSGNVLIGIVGKKRKSAAMEKVE